MLYLDSLVYFDLECKPWFPKKLLGECYLGNFQKMHGLVKSKVEIAFADRMLNTYDVLQLWKDDRCAKKLEFEINPNILRRLCLH